MLLVPVWPSGLMTVTLQVPATIPLGTVPPIDVDDDTATPVIETLLYPVLVRLTLVPLVVVLKFVPLIVTEVVVVFNPVAGVIPVQELEIVWLAADHSTVIHAHIEPEGTIRPVCGCTPAVHNKPVRVA